MSGGHFDYKQYTCTNIADEIDSLISRNKEQDWMNYSDETIKRFELAAFTLRVAAVYAQRVDWLICGDDGEDTFHERLDIELKELVNEFTR